MNRKTLITTITLTSIALALLLIAAPTYANPTYADMQPTAQQLALKLQYYNGSPSPDTVVNMIPLANQQVTIKINDTVFKNVWTNETGYVVLTDTVPVANVNISVWWNASWGVSYLVNYTAGITLQNDTAINCSIYNVNLRPEDSRGEILPYAIVKVIDVNASTTMYEVNVGSSGVTGGLKLPAPLDESDPTSYANYYFRRIVYWTPTTPISMIKVLNVTDDPNDILMLSDYTAQYGYASMTCSVYYITVSYILTQNDDWLSSQSDLLILACIYSNGTLLSTQARVYGGETTLRVATIAEDDVEGAGRLSDYEFRVYWRWETPSIEYLVYIGKNAFGTITGNADYGHESRIYTNTVTLSIQLVDKNNNPLALSDVSIIFPIYNYTFSTSTGTSGAYDGCIDWSALVGTSYNWYEPDCVPLPIKHNDTVLTYKIKATYEGVPVLDQEFNLLTWGTDLDGRDAKIFTCNVYWVSFSLLDYHNRNLEGNAKLTVTYPDAGVSITFMIIDGIGGRRLPGGSNLTAVINYKDVYDLPTLEPTTFNINDTSTTITLKFPIYDLIVYAYDFYGKTIVENLNGTISFTGSLWPTQVAEYNSTGKYHVFKQLPRGGTYSLDMYTRSDGTTPGFERATGKLMGSATITMPDSDLTINITTPLYNPTFVIKAADGSDIPTELLNDTYIVIQANTSTESPVLVNNTVEITYESNQTKGICFVGEWAYPVRVYIAGVVVYDQDVVLPEPAETQTITLYVNLYNSTARVLTYDGDYPIPSVSFRLGWTGVNVTEFDANALLTENWAAYGDYFRNVETLNSEIIAYNESSAITDEAGEVAFWIPVWNLSGLNYTTVIYGIYTIPGQTGGVPSDAPAVPITHCDYEKIGIEGKLMNVSTAQDLGDIKAYAYNFYVKVIDYLEKPLNDFTVFVNGSFVAGEFSDDVIAIKKSNSSGMASFISGAEGIFYFANYTYSVYAFQDPAIPYPQMVGEEPALNASEWSHNKVVCLQFPGALIVKALDWEGDPLVGAKVELYWANGTWAGGLTAYAVTDNEGTAVIYMSNTWSIYTVEVWWRDSIVNQKYRLEEQLTFPEGVKVYSYAERMMVYSPKIMLVSDMGAALPAGITVEVVWPDGQTKTYTTDGSGSIMMAQAPIGKYIVKAYWDNIKIYDSELWIESDVPVTLKTTVYEVELNFLTPRGAPLAGAEVQVVYPDGSTETLTLDSEGKAVLPLVAVDEAHNTLTVQSVTWRDATIELADNTAIIESSGPVTFYAANVYTLSVSVVGSQGQPLDGATVTVLKDGKPIATATAEGGVATVELPEGTYTVQASYLGKKGETSVTLTTDTTATVSLDVFMVIGNQAFSVGEVVLWIVIAIIIVLVLAAIIILMTRIGRRKTATLETS